MSIIDQFLEDYKQRMDSYDRLAQLCAMQCENGLRRNGLRALVTYRAKRLDSLLEKVTYRNEEKNYQTIDEIYQDIVDLAGVRIALYFPGDRREVDAFVRSQFTIERIKSFPEDIDYTYPYPKRYSGYSARHYRIRLKPSTLHPEDRFLSNLLVELQVGSVLMHSWAEVEHDLVYKNRLGQLSHDEYVILDELNGLMHAGEMALERLQQAVKKRVQTECQPFSNHYELAAYLYDYRRRKAPERYEPLIGRADILFRFLQIIGLDTVPKLEPILALCSPNSIDKPLVDQLIDRILAQNAKYHEAYAQAHKEVDRIDPFVGTLNEKNCYFSDKKGFGFFIQQWNKAEALLKETVGSILLSKLDSETLKGLENVQEIREQILHSDSWPSEEELTNAGLFLQKLLDNLSQRYPEIRHSLDRKLPSAKNL